MDSSDKFKVIGMMSGTSLDGLDIAFCTFQKQNNQWRYHLEAAQTITYSKSWHSKLALAHTLPGASLINLHVEYGKYLGIMVQAFLIKNKISKIDFISSHGHTVFHQPGNGFTFQLGDGNAIHAALGLPVVYDFRMLDVTLGGQGAPLVPIGDKLLFNEYDICLNLGGIANLSLEKNQVREAYDICFANMGLNYLASKANLRFDKDGNLASKGEVNAALFESLQGVYKRWRKKRPSLGNESFMQYIKPILDRSRISIENKLATFVELIATEIAFALATQQKRLLVLCTGGGAFNSYLIYRLVELCDSKIDLIIPEEDIINYKEALIFSFLGVLRVCGETNVLKEVTGAKMDSSSGVMIGFR